MSERLDVFVSLAVTLPPDAARSFGRIEELAAFLRAQYTDYELVLIDNARQSPAGDDAMNRLLARVEKLRFLRLAGRISDEAALSAGLENAIGDVIFLGDLRLATPELVADAVRCCLAGSDVVVGCAPIRRPFWYRFGSFAFRTAFGKMLGYEVPDDDTHVRCVSRRAGNAVMATGRFHHHLFIRLARCGYRVSEVVFTPPPDAAASVRPAAEFARAISMLVFNSIRPLRIINLCGLCGSAAAFGIAVSSILIKLFRNHVVEGWTALMFFMSIQFFLLFLILAFIGEYLVRLLMDRTDDAAYTVMCEKHSSVMLDAERLNIRENSETKSPNFIQTGRDR